MGTAPASASEAMDMVHAGLGYLAAADATGLPAGLQARLLAMLEQATAMGTAARAAILAAFTSGQGYAADADYSPRAWLISKTRVTKGAAVGYTAWARRAAAHPQVIQALAAGEMSESYARRICQWTDKLPAQCRGAADEVLVTAAKAGADLRDLGGLAAEIYARSLPEQAGKDQDQVFEDRSVRLETTFDGAGVLYGDLTPECAAVVGAVLDALSAPAGAQDTRTHAQRCHDALQEAIRQRINCIVIGVTSASLASFGRRPYRRRGCCRARLPCHRPQSGRPSLHCAITGLPGRQGEQSLNSGNGAS